MRNGLLFAILLLAQTAFGQIRGPQLNIDNIQLDGSTISTTNTNGDLTISPNGTGKLVIPNLGTSVVPYFDASSKLTGSLVSPTELNYLDGVTSSVQTQLNAKAPLVSPNFDNGVFFNEETAVGTVPAGQRALYPKADGKFYHKGSDNVETAVGSGSGGGSNHGVLVNGGFEEFPATTGWNIGAGVNCVADLIDVADDGGKQSIVCALTAAQGDLLHQTYSTNAVFDFENSIFAKTSTANLELCSLIAGQTYSCVDLPTTGHWQKSTVESVTRFGYASAIVVRTKNNAVVTGALRADNAYMGMNRNIGTAAQSSFYGKAVQPGAANCIFSQNTSSSESDFVALGTAPTCTSNWVTDGGVTAVGPTSQRINLAAKPARYVVTVNGLMFSNLGNQNCIFKISDGTTVFGYASTFSFGSNSSTSTLIGEITYTSPGSRQLYIVSSDNNSGTCSMENSTVGRSFEWMVESYPLAAEQVVNLGQTRDGMGDVFYTSKTQCPAGSEDADGAAISRSTPLGQSLVAGGLIYGTGDGSTTVNKPDLRGIFVRATGSQVISGQTYTGTQGTKQADQMQGHKHQTLAPTSAGGSTTWGLQYWSANRLIPPVSVSDEVAGVPVTDGVNGTPRTGAQNHPANIALKACIQNVFTKAPLVKHAVVTSSEGVEVTERASVTVACTSSPCAIASQSGAWMTSITRSSTGIYTGNIAAGVFSGRPSCSIASRDSTIVCSSPTTSPTQIDSACRALVTGALTDVGFEILCQGPR